MPKARHDTALSGQPRSPQPLAMRPAATLLIFAAALSLLLQAASASRLSPPLSSPMGGAGVPGREEKVRLGSSPPICKGRCYECSPCVAVQVPSLSSPSGPSAARGTNDAAVRAADLPLLPFSNYKPLWWKCQCRDRLYDP